MWVLLKKFPFQNPQSLNNGLLQPREHAGQRARQCALSAWPVDIDGQVPVLWLLGGSGW